MRGGQERQPEDGDEQQQRAQHKIGDGIPDQRDGAGQVIDPAILADGGNDPEGHAEAEQDQDQLPDRRREEEEVHRDLLVVQDHQQQGVDPEDPQPDERPGRASLLGRGRLPFHEKILSGGVTHGKLRPLQGHERWLARR